MHILLFFAGGTASGIGTDPTDYGTGDFEDFLDWRMYRIRRWNKHHPNKPPKG